MRNKGIFHQTGLQDIISQETGHTWVICEAIKIGCVMGKGIPERSHSHTFVSLHNARFIRGNLPNKPIGYTQRKRSLPDRSEQNEPPAQSPIQGGIHRWKGGHWPQVWQL